jgi:diguanylate cyclase (GGDEF)-like protein/PAS domain S-box-containing protein
VGPLGELSPPAVTVLAAVGLLALVLGVLLARSRGGAAQVRSAEARRSAALERRLAGVMAAGRDGLVVHREDGRIVALNEAAAAMLDVDATRAVSHPVTDLPVRWLTETGEPVSPALVFRPVAPPLVGPTPGQPPSLVVALAPASGRPPRWVQVSTRAVPALDGSPEQMTTIADVTGPREIRAALARSETQFRAAMENAPIGMVLVDPQWRLQQVNRAFAELLGAEESSLLGRDLSALSHPEDRAAERANVQRLLAGEGKRFTQEKRYLRLDGQTVWAVLDVVLVRTPEGVPDHFVAQVRDITDSRLQSEMLSHRAMHDPLTGLANRSLMQEVLQAAVEKPGASDRVAVLVIDLDEFKQINDRYGHPAGDEVLVHVAGVLRAATAGRGTPARLGGDEFVVVIEDPDAARVAFEVAAGIHRGLSTPVRTARRRLPVRASVGIAVAELSILGGGAMGMLAAADAALYRAKASGRGHSEVYDSSMEMTGATKHGAAAELSEAISSGQLVLHYQPIVDLASGQVRGEEALVRWQHPERGLLLPGSFLPTAEETGLGTALGLSVVTQAAAYLARTRDAGRWVSVNVSADQLGDGAFAERVLSDVAEYRVAPGRLVVELTEASLVGAGTRVRHELTQLRSAGVPVMLDDFGTGASPLSYLRDLPVNGVKLDMSFTAGIPDDPAAARVSRALGALAREMEMTTIAAGIETQEQADFLRSSGWHFGQGWLFGAGQSEPVVGL